MAQPTVIFFEPDTPIPGESPRPKVFLRTLLFAASKRGRVIEGMYVALSRNEARQNFNIWVYGNEKLVRRSGLFVGETGVKANHHFLIPRDGSAFHFAAGRYRMDVFAKLLGDRGQTLLFSQVMEIPHEIGIELKEPSSGLYFDWGPDSSRYLPHVDRRPPMPTPKDFMDLFGLAQYHTETQEKP